MLVRDSMTAKVLTIRKFTGIISQSDLLGSVERL
jgi:hypothetical protein